jgi:hypothetical protein
LFPGSAVPRFRGARLGLKPSAEMRSPLKRAGPGAWIARVGGLGRVGCGSLVPLFPCSLVPLFSAVYASVYASVHAGHV